jgi:hypothetical protein
MENERVAYKIPEWGTRYGFSRAKAYQIIAAGRGPRVVEIDGLQRITREADDEWRHQLMTAKAVEAA